MLSGTLTTSMLATLTLSGKNATAITIELRSQTNMFVFIKSFAFVAILTSPQNTVRCASSLSFLLLGDWGKGGTTGSYGSRRLDIDAASMENNAINDVLANQKTYYQVPIAQAMGTYTNQTSNKPSFVLALGDNFYANGVSSSTDVLWSYLWKNVYLDYPGLNIPWYPVFGNHDYGGSTDAQIQRYLDHTDDDIWMFEAQYYLKEFSIPGGGTVAILCIDTTTLAPSINKCCNQNGGISQETQMERIVAQMTFINASLASLSGVNRPTWLFVAGHYPMFSIGSNGGASELQTYLQPVLEHYGVDAYFCGHDHMSEHLEHNGVHYFVAGGGSMTDSYKQATTATLKWYGPDYSAFGVVEASEDSYAVQFIDAYGEQKYLYSVENTRTKSPSARDTARPGDDDADYGGGGKGVVQSVVDLYNDLMENHPVMVMSGGVLSMLFVFALCYVAYRRSAVTSSSSALKAKKAKRQSGGVSLLDVSRTSPPYRGVDSRDKLGLPSKHKRTEATVFSTMFSTVDSTEEAPQQQQARRRATTASDEGVGSDSGSDEDSGDDDDDEETGRGSVLATVSSGSSGSLAPSTTAATQVSTGGWVLGAAAYDEDNGRHGYNSDQRNLIAEWKQFGSGSAAPAYHSLGVGSASEGHTPLRGAGAKIHAAPPPPNTPRRARVPSGLRLSEFFGSQVSPEDVRTRTVDGRLLSYADAVEGAPNLKHQRATTMPV